MTKMELSELLISQVDSLVSELEENVVTPMDTLKSDVSDIEIIQDIIDGVGEVVHQLETAMLKVQEIDMDPGVDIVEKYTSYWYVSC